MADTPLTMGYGVWRDQKWGARTEPFEDGSRVIVYGYDNEEEAHARLRAWLAEELERMNWPPRLPVFLGYCEGLGLGYRERDLG